MVPLAIPNPLISRIRSSAGPYVGTTLGAGNYRSFVMFMFFGFFGVSMTAVAALQYVLTMTFNVVAWIILVDMAVR